jgi:hypothetical protein
MCRIVAALLLIIVPLAASAQDLPSWRDTQHKQEIIEFVTAVTTEDGPDYVKPELRVAVFDNDGTL